MLFAGILHTKIYKLEFFRNELMETVTKSTEIVLDFFNAGIFPKLFLGKWHGKNAWSDFVLVLVLFDKICRLF